MTTTQQADTMVPPSYPELEREVYRSLDDSDTDRPTLIPASSEIEELCAESKR